MCLVVDRAASRAPLEEAIAAAVRAGVDWVQVRERALEGRDLLEHARAVARVARAAAGARGGRVRVIVNRRADVALACGADGIHLGGDAMAPAQARALLGPEAWVGVSCHAASEAREADPAASYAQLAPIFAPLSKAATRPALGLAALAAACAAASLPILAQGGLDAERAAAAVAAGAAGIAVTGAILLAPDPAAAAAALRRALDSTISRDPPRKVA